MMMAPGPTPSPFSSKCKVEGRSVGNYPLSASFTVQKCEKYAIPGKNPFTYSGIQRRYGILLSGTAPYFKNLASEPDTDYEMFNKVIINISQQKSENGEHDIVGYLETVTPEGTWSFSTGALTDGTYNVTVNASFCFYLSEGDIFEKTVDVRHEPFDIAVTMRVVPIILVLWNMYYLSYRNPFISSIIPYEIVLLLNTSYILAFLVCCIIFRVCYYWRFVLFLLIILQLKWLENKRHKVDGHFTITQVSNFLKMTPQQRQKRLQHNKLTTMTYQQRQTYLKNKRYASMTPQQRRIQNKRPLMIPPGGIMYDGGKIIKLDPSLEWVEQNPDWRKKHPQVIQKYPKWLQAHPQWKIQLQQSKKKQPQV